MMEIPSSQYTVLSCVYSVVMVVWILLLIDKSCCQLKHTEELLEWFLKKVRYHRESKAIEENTAK